MLRHTRWNRAFIVFREPDGRRRQVMLGPWGAPETQRRYHVELAKWHARQRSAEEAAALVVAEANANLTVAGAAARWLLHCETYYRRADGTQTSEVPNCRSTLAILLELFADEPANEFGPKKLKVVRERMIAGDPRLPAEQRRGWCRPLSNSAVGRIRRMFKWLSAEELVPASVPVRGTALAPLGAVRHVPLRRRRRRTVGRRVLLAGAGRGRG